MLSRDRRMANLVVHDVPSHQTACSTVKQRPEYYWINKHRAPFGESVLIWDCLWSHVIALSFFEPPHSVERPLCRLPVIPEVWIAEATNSSHVFLRRILSLLSTSMLMNGLARFLHQTALVLVFLRGFSTESISFFSTRFADPSLLDTWTSRLVAYHYRCRTVNVL